jgi:hypothetical protein
LVGNATVVEANMSTLCYLHPLPACCAVLCCVACDQVANVTSSVLLYLLLLMLIGSIGGRDVLLLFWEVARVCVCGGGMQQA